METPTNSNPPADTGVPPPAPGSTIETTERKVAVALCGLCIAIFCAAVLGIAFHLHLVAGLAAVALIAWWIGSSIAEVLKETRERDSSNTQASDAKRSD